MPGKEVNVPNVRPSPLAHRLVRRSLGSPARRAVVLPGARLAD